MRRTTRYLFVLLALALATCSQQPPTTTSTPGAPSPAPSSTATAAPTREPTPPPTAAPVILNADVVALPVGGYSCQDYPCPDDAAGWEQRIQTPAGFRVEHFAVVPDRPTSITFGPDQLLYVAAMSGVVYRIDRQGGVEAWLDQFTVPVGLAFESGGERLYISDRAGEEEARIGYVLLNDLSYHLLVAGLPCCYANMHAANGLAFGPDGMLYAAIGARADHGEVLNTDLRDQLHPLEASIIRVDENGAVTNYARGLRNAFDIAWDSQGRLFAGNNGPDFGPPDTLHRIVAGAEHGYPWFECDNCFGPPAPEMTIVPPVYEFLPHSAPAGLTAYVADTFPPDYQDNLFVTLWSAFAGAQKIVRFSPNAAAAADWATGFAAPIDVTVGPDGALYVADWATGVIFKIVYEG